MNLFLVYFCFPNEITEIGRRFNLGILVPIDVYGPALQDTVIVLHTNRVSGTVDAWMATTDQSQKSAESTLHMQGDWHCG